MTHRFGMLIALTFAMATPVVAQVKDSSSKPPPAKRTPPARFVTITYTDNAFDVPAVIAAGVNRIIAVNHGKELHQGSLVRLDSGRTVTDLLAALKGPAPLPGWATLAGGPQNSGTAIMTLAAGNYVWVCFIPSLDGVPHYAKGMIRPMQVGPAKVSASAPAADIVVTMVDYTWKFSKPITRGRHVLRVVTDQKSQPHELMVVRLAPGKSVADVMAWVANPVGLPPAESIEGVAPMKPGSVAYTIVDFRRGRYVLICLVPDAKDGKSHALHGMVQELTVQ